MCRKHLQIILIFTLFFLSWPLAQAFTTLPPGPKPVRVQVGLYLNDILAMTEMNETLQFDATQTLRWKDKRLAFDKEDLGTSVKNYETQAAKRMLSKIWHPQVALTEGRSPRKVQMMHLSIASNGLVTWSEHFQASTEMPMDFRNFPFDKQVVQISLSPFLNDAAMVQFQNLQQYGGVATRAHMPGWFVARSVTGITTQTSPLYKKPFSQYDLIIQYNRISTYYVYQIFLPIILIVLLAFSVFWMLKNPLVNRVAISLTAVLTIVVFQWRIATKLPQVSYHTFADAFLLTSFIVAASTIIASIILASREPPNSRLVILFRVFYPITYLLAILVVGLIFFG